MNEAKDFILNAIKANKSAIAETVAQTIPQTIASTESNSSASAKKHPIKSIPEYLREKPAIPTFPKSDKPLLDEFKESLVAGGGTWHEVTNETEAQTRIKTLHPDARIICSATPEIKGNKDITTITDPHDLDDVDVGVIRAVFGVSETGMVWVTEKELYINALGFLSQHLVILLDPKTIVRDMYEAYQWINLHKFNYGCFMLGPSATADIGAYMVRGAQGARTLAVFFM